MQNNQDLILVTGGTGHLGRDLVPRLLAQDFRVRVLARLPGTDSRVQWAQGDLATGEGITSALAGVTKVIHAATFSPVAQRGHFRLIDFFRTPSAVDVQGTGRLLDACRRAGVRNFMHVSIAGLDPEGSLPYNRVKIEGERLVRGSDVPWSILHATPFYYLLARLFLSMRWMPWWPVPDAVMQPVDTSDVAACLTKWAGDPQPGVLPEIGGPQARPLPVFAQEYLQARGIHRKVLKLRVSPESARRMGFAPANGVSGTVSWHDWLEQHEDEPKGRVRKKPLPARPFGVA